MCGGDVSSRSDHEHARMHPIYAGSYNRKMSDQTIVILFAFAAVYGAVVLGFRYGDRCGYLRGRKHGDDLLAVERMQAEWRRCDRRFDRVHLRKRA